MSNSSPLPQRTVFKSFHSEIRRLKRLVGEAPDEGEFTEGFEGRPLGAQALLSRDARTQDTDGERQQNSTSKRKRGSTVHSGSRPRPKKTRRVSSPDGLPKLKPLPELVLPVEPLGLPPFTDIQGNEYYFEGLTELLEWGMEEFCSCINTKYNYSSHHISLSRTFIALVHQLQELKAQDCQILPGRAASFFLEQHHIHPPFQKSLPEDYERVPDWFTAVLPVAALDIECNSLSESYQYTSPQPLFVKNGGKWCYWGDYQAAALLTIPHAYLGTGDFQTIRDDPWIKNMPQQLRDIGLGPNSKPPHADDRAPSQLVLAGFVYHAQNEDLTAALKTELSDSEME